MLRKSLWVMSVLLAGAALLGRAADPMPKASGATNDITLRWRAEQGEATAQNNLGVCYLSGTGVLADQAEAVKWFRKAADQGDAKAQLNLGACYLTGAGVAKDATVAAQWFRKAAELGDAKAQFNLGVCYRKGEGIGADMTKAALWFRKASEQGLASAQYNMAMCYVAGAGVPEDFAEAYKWFNLAGLAGNEQAAAAREELAKTMTPAQITEAQARTQQWQQEKTEARAATH